MKHAIDLAPAYIQSIKDILQHHLPPHAKIWVFGSRVTGQAKPYSDVDLAVDIGEPLPLGMLAKLSSEFEESTLPYKVDIVDWHSISDTFRDKILQDRIRL